MARPSKVSQTQLAKELGISQALVSAVLNGHKSEVNPGTYERIWKHALKRGYHPKGMQYAASPVTREQQVGFIMRAPLRLYRYNNYFGHVQHGLHEALSARGDTAVFLGSEDLLDGDKLKEVFYPGRPLRGVVLLGEVARPFLDRLRSLAPRIVAVSARYPGHCHSVLGNEPQALEQLVKHLTGLGHKRIGWLGGNIDLGRHATRLMAFKAALVSSGLVFNPRYNVALHDAERTEGADAVHRILGHAKRRDFPTAFICYNGTMAAGAVSTFQREGWDVPGDVSVASADLSRLNFEESPHITGAGTNPEKMGETAARLALGEGLPDEGFTDLMLPSQLMTGETTGRVRTKS